MSFADRAKAALKPTFGTVDEVLAALDPTEQAALVSMLTNRTLGAKQLRVDINEELEAQGIPLKVSEKSILIWRRTNDVR